MKNADEPAFPTGQGVTNLGLSKREHFALECLRASLTNGTLSSMESLVRESIRYADEMLKQLEQK